MTHISAVGASPGIAQGPVFVLNTTSPEVPDVAEPAAAFGAAVVSVTEDLKALQEAARTRGRDEAADILGAQALMAEDPMLTDAVNEALEAGSRLGGAIDTAADSISSMLAAMTDEYLAARAADVLEIADRIRHKLAGTTNEGLSGIADPMVVVATVLTAADTAQLDPALVLGFVTEEGGPTSHVAVIARALGIPAVVGAGGLIEASAGATAIAIDGGSGDVVFDPDDEVVADFAARAARAKELNEAAQKYRGVRVTHGDKTVLVAANVGTTEDVERAVSGGADGVGLFRTEFLFLDRAKPPTEDEQYEVYAAAVSAFTDPVVIRTLDIGGDKPAAYLDTPAEENPFLGERGIRLYERFADLFSSQVKALLRAALLGDLWVMLPMVATVADLLAVRRVFDEARSELDAAGVAHGDPKIGIMIEVPSAAINAPQLARHSDFFSIGTNDLTQYTMAADRTNGRLAAYSDAAHPAVLGLCSLAASAAAAAGISIGVCGESASDPQTAAMFAAMGIDKLSVSPPAVNRIKAVVDGLDEGTAAGALAAALAADSAAEVRRLVGEMTGVQST